MRRALPTLAALLLAGLALAGPARAGAPELMERAVLPVTPDLPTCACTVPMPDGDQLVVGLANGEVVSFHESAGRVIPRVISFPGDGPIDDIVACRVGRSAGSPNEFVLLAVRGAKLFSIGFGDMSVAGSVALAPPSGRYRFAKATGEPSGVQGVSPPDRADHPVLFDDDSAIHIRVDTRTLLPRLELVVDGAPGLAVTALSDREVVVAGSRIIECDVHGPGTQIDERTDLADEPVRVVVVGVSDDGRTLGLRVTDPDSVWVSRTVATPGSISVVASISDSVVAMGGTVALTPSYDVGWVALVDARGEIVAATDHASPVTNITRVSGFIAVQGDGRNLSVYDMELNPLWDHDSPVTDVVLLSGDFAGSASDGLAVVGTRTFRVGTADADSIRTCLHMPGFMAGAARVDGGYELRRSFIIFCVSNEDRLRQMLNEGSRAVEDAFAIGDIDGAIVHATTARSAAAVLGERDELNRLSSRLRDLVTFVSRRRALLLAAFVLAALGVWVAVECARTTAGPVVSAAGAVLLFASGALSWRIIGNTGLNPSLLAGGTVAALAVARAQVARTPKRPVAGSAVESLVRALMEFLHGAGEGVPSEGVVDAARKSVTKVAYLAQEMVDSMGDEERYVMLKERLRSRGDDFLDTTHPRVAALLALSKRAGFIVHEAEQMSRAAERMKTAITTILSDAPVKPPVLRQQLLAIKEGRDQLAAAADRAWAIVQTNPGCSLTRSIDRILEEKQGELAGVRVKRGLGVPAERDAVALWSFELRFILENLVTNALRAMRSSKERVLSIETATDGAVCSVRVADTGAGMDEATARTIFDAKDDERDGGFGMPNSRLRLRERGGDIAAEHTAPGEGTTFLLTIPHWTPNTGDPDV